MKSVITNPEDIFLISSTEDLNKATKVLENDHYGLEDVKKRIIEYLSVRKLKNDNKLKIKGEKKNERNKIIFKISNIRR